MQNRFVTILALCSLAVSASAQGTFVMDSGANYGNGSGPTATTGGLVWIVSYSLGDPINGTPVLDTSTDINIGLLWGTAPGGVTNQFNLDSGGLNHPSSPNWLASQPTGAGDITSYGGGAIFDPNGNGYVVPGEAAGTTIWLVLQGWTGNSTSFGIATGETGQTAPFSITLAANTSPLQPDLHNMPALVIEGVPEPSLPVLSAIGALAFAFFRRRK